jgi:hypothetical protein
MSEATEESPPTFEVDKAKPPVFGDEEPSEMFWNALTGGGSMVVTCEHCGRTFFGTYHEGWYDEGELEELREKARQFPERYIEDVAYDSYSHGHVDGKTLVYGCPCNAGRRYEDWIWNHRYLIASYLKERAADAAVDAKLAAAVAESAGAVDPWASKPETAKGNPGGVFGRYYEQMKTMTFWEALVLVFVPKQVEEIEEAGRVKRLTVKKWRGKTYIVSIREG